MFLRRDDLLWQSINPHLTTTRGGYHETSKVFNEEVVNACTYISQTSENISGTQATLGSFERKQDAMRHLPGHEYIGESIAGRVHWLCKVRFHMYSIWLFTYSDLKTIVGPKTAFGVLSALRPCVFGISTTDTSLNVVGRVPVVAFWTWINLLPFAISNQCQPEAIQEDNLNKPWRPLPAKRLTPEQAKRLMFVLYPIACLTSAYIGGIWQCLALIALGYWYNNRNGADANFITRNFINACGFVCYTSGALEVSIGQRLPLELSLMQWFSIVGLVVFTTVQTQDMFDQAGDSLRGRRTVPLVIGDGPSRWSIAVPMAVWCLFVPYYWGMSTSGYVVPVSLALVVIVRTLTKRSVKDDKLTFRVWNIWLVSLYLLPLLGSVAGLS